MREKCCTSDQRVRVSVRFRPTATFAHDIIQLEEDFKTIHIHSRHHYNHKGCAVHNFIHDWTFKTDAVLYNASQERVYQTVAQDIVPRVMDGKNGAILCYGQTGTGKTFTMFGIHQKYQDRGIAPRTIQQVFREVQKRANDRATSIKVSYTEIYNEALTDLLCPKPPSDGNHLIVVEDGDGIRVKGLTYCPVQAEEEALCLLFRGETARRVHDHVLNANSSRGHAIFTLHVHSSSLVESSATYRDSTLHLVDLAGSERIGKTGSTGQTQAETSYINRSLTCLEQCMIRLADKGRGYVPYRQSKLTHVLRDSIDSKCDMRLVLNVSGESTHIEETLSSLRFAVRLMCVPCDPAVRDICDPQQKVIQLQKEVLTLKDELAMQDTLSGRQQVQYETLSYDEMRAIRSQVVTYLQGDRERVDIVNLQQIRAVYQTFKDVYKEIENALMNEIREKYDLVPKVEAPRPESYSCKKDKEKNLVGERDGKGFGVGVADGIHKATVSPVIHAVKKSRHMQKRREPKSKDSSPEVPVSTRKVKSGRETDPGTDKHDSDSDNVLDEVEDLALEKSEAVLPLDKTIPSKEEALKEFKCGVYFSLNQTLEENRVITKQKHDKYACLVRKANDLKAQIDAMKCELEIKQSERHLAGEKYDDVGNIIIGEAEKRVIKILKDLEEKYHKCYEELLTAKYELSHMRKIVEEDQRKFLEEFQQYFLKKYGSVPPDMLDTCSQRPTDANEKMLKVLSKDVGSQEERKYYMIRKDALQKVK